MTYPEVLSAEQALWLKHSSLSETPVTSHTTVRIEAPSKLTKVFAITALRNELRKLKRKNVVNTAVSKPNATVALGMFKLDIDTLSPRLKNNRDAHEVYIEKTIEYADTLCGFVESARAHNPSEPLLEYACMFTKHVQELLVYVSQTCPSSPKSSEKLVVVTPINKDKIVRFVEPVTSSNNIPKQTNYLKTKDYNKPLLTSTTVKPTTSASGSKPSDNTKNNRITNALVKHSVRNAKFESMCAICNKCLFDANHDMCLIDHVNVRSKSKSKRKKREKLGNLQGSNATDVPSSSSLINESKFLGTIRFGNDQVAKIMGYGDYQQGNVIISRVYYVKGLRHNLFSVGQYCDADLEVAFEKNTCFIQNLEGVNLLSGSRNTNLYIISLDDMLKTSLIYLLSKASKTKSWLWHRRLSHLNFACALGKSKKSSHQPKAKDTNQEKLYLLHMDLCGPMHVDSINEKKYILVIVDDYSRFTWVKFMRSKDEAPDAIIKCIKNIQVRLNATIRNVRTDNGIEFVNKNLRDFYENVSISHQTSVARTPQQNGVVERRNRTLMEVARTMFIFSKAPLFL
ncbi:retrovirus-related pol polyprotein from transposon TNT 1-94 [Tanacetum coccineum]